MELEQECMNALMDGIINVTCKECGQELQAEPDTSTCYCDNCGKIVEVNNPLLDNGMI